MRLFISDTQRNGDCILIGILYVVCVDRDSLHHQRLNYETSLIRILVDILSIVCTGLVDSFPYESLAVRNHISFGS